VHQLALHDCAKPSLGRCDGEVRPSPLARRHRWPTLQAALATLELGLPWAPRQTLLTRRRPPRTGGCLQRRL